MPSVQLLKSEKRVWFKSHLRQVLGQSSQWSLSHSLILDHLLSLNIWDTQRTIASYCALKGEISPAHFEQKVSKNACFVFPQIRDEKMSFAPSTGKWELSSQLNFFQPVGKHLKPVQNIDVFLVPGLAFDREGRRLGRGAGWYDRKLSESLGLRIGLAHTCQISNSPLPEEKHDMRMDVVVTEKYWFSPIHKKRGFLNMQA